ncbi:hypothetical protein ACFUYE_32385 [Micromonospora humida]|uniref:hypothetical protein n=1 Tax=Micromonospora humida TaxID=2809018 RepID=UPI00366C1EAE
MGSGGSGGAQIPSEITTDEPPRDALTDTAELRLGDAADEPGRPGAVDRRPGQDEPARVGDGDTRRWPADDPVTGPPGT